MRVANPALCPPPAPRAGPSARGVGGRKDGHALEDACAALPSYSVHALE